MSDLDQVTIGSRIYCDRHVGTVLFYGQVPPTEGTWLGVDWDDPQRGKHDGSLNGVRYFVARYPKSGSFVRPRKVDFGLSCLEAIRQRYQSDSKNLSGDNDNLYIVMQNNAVLPIKAIGYEKISSKQSKLSLLRIVCIQRLRVSSEGPPKELLESVPNVVELDISHNLFSSWLQMANICQQLGRLTILNISGNKLGVPEDPASLETSFSNVRVIIMNRMNYSWNQVLACCTALPNLLQLHVGFNEIEQLAVPPQTVLHCLESLNLEGNPVANWSEINKLGALPRLKSLNLTSTSLDGVKLEGDNVFPALEMLQLQDNKLRNWSDINELNKLPSLEQLNIVSNPLLELDKPNTIRQLLIARIGKLKFLNRTAITQKERRGAELDFLKKYGKEWLDAARLASETARRLFNDNYPRYGHLVQVHGAPEESEINVQPVVLKNSLLSLEIHSLMLDKPVVKKLPATMNVQKLRGLVQRLVHKENAVLACESNAMPGHCKEMSNDLRELSFYVDDGDRILVT